MPPLHHMQEAPVLCPVYFWIFSLIYFRDLDHVWFLVGAGKLSLPTLFFFPPAPGPRPLLSLCGLGRFFLTSPLCSGDSIPAPGLRPLPLHDPFLFLLRPPASRSSAPLPGCSPVPAPGLSSLSLRIRELSFVRGEAQQGAGPVVVPGADRAAKGAGGPCLRLHRGHAAGG